MRGSRERGLRRLDTAVRSRGPEDLVAPRPDAKLPTLSGKQLEVLRQVGHHWTAAIASAGTKPCRWIQS
jgi:hypothetical protein